jgi:hypothetical protein
MAKVHGVKEIENLLRQLPINMQANVVRSGNRAIANEFVKRVKANPNLPATVRSAIISSVGYGIKRKKGLYMVGLRKRFAPLAHLIEYGTDDRYQKQPRRTLKFGTATVKLGKKRGRYTGRMPANPFLRPLLDYYSSEDIEAIWAKAAERNFNLQLRKLAKMRGW